MNKQIITSKGAPAPIGPYSQAVQVGNLLFVSGQVAIHPQTNQLIINNIEDETHRVMQNIEAILIDSGLEFNNIVKATIFLSSMDLFGAVNEIYGSYFSSSFPARETIAVKELPKKVNVEISVIASL